MTVQGGEVLRSAQREPAQAIGITSADGAWSALRSRGFAQSAAQSAVIYPWTELELICQSYLLTARSVQRVPRPLTSTIP